ncbi:MAG TPA: hypothetical protein VNY36_00515, partial [Bacteroidia bacterium]|nr:hypothetical protein [Bacteroidia bacterium]
DIICIHPNPKKSGKQIRVQVKSRYQTDSDGGFPLKKESLDGFDFLVFVKLNIGYFFSKHKIGNSSKNGRQEAEYYTLTREFCLENHKVEGSWQKVKTNGVNMDKYKNEKGFELIAKKLKIDYPTK